MPLSSGGRDEVELIDSRNQKSILDPSGPNVERAAPPPPPGIRGGFFSAPRYVALDPTQRRLLGLGGFGRRRWFVICSSVLLFVVLGLSIAVWQKSGKAPAAAAPTMLPSTVSATGEDFTHGWELPPSDPASFSGAPASGEQFTWAGSPGTGEAATPQDEFEAQQKLLPGVDTPLDFTGAPEPELSGDFNNYTAAPESGESASELAADTAGSPLDSEGQEGAAQPGDEYVDADIMASGEWHPPTVPDAESPPSHRAYCNYTGVTVPEGLLTPLTYNISLTFVPQNFLPADAQAQHTFSSTTEATFAVQQDTSCLVLHSVGLGYERIMIWSDVGDICVCGPGCRRGSCSQTVANVSSGVPSIPQSMIRIDLGSVVLPAGSNATLAFQYTGAFNPQQQGIYRSAPYIFTTPGVGKEASVLLVTQLESSGARHVFPSYDEPSYKARYNLALTYPSGLKALSNMPATGPAVPAEAWGQETLLFETTPLMSTYLVAICIGNIVPMSASKGGALNVSVWSVPELQKQLQFPLQTSTRALDFYTNYTGIQQPLAKFDLVAVPGKQGAMENYGLLLFDETRFLWNKDTEGAYGKWLSANVICHELAHQWFGNLVTAKDWTQITVNEGLASFMEYKCIEAVLPEANGAALFHRAMSPMGEALGIHEGPRNLAALVDDEPYTPSLVPKVDEFGQPALPSSGAIVYSKGAAIFRMLEGYWEAGRAGSFQEGLQRFLQKHKYGNASVQDVLASLWETFNNPEADVDGNQGHAATDLALLERWFSQPGIPLLNITLETDDLQQFTIAQSRFMVWTDDTEPVSEPWLAPLSLGGFGEMNRRWLGLRDTSAAVPQESLPNKGPAWSCNGRGHGLFRSSYPSSLLKTMATAFQQLEPISEATMVSEQAAPEGEAAAPAQEGGSSPSSIEAFLEAAAVVDDVFALLHAGMTDPADVFGITEAIANSSAVQGGFGEYLLWGTLLDRLGMLRQLLLDNSTCIEDFDRYTSAMLALQSSHITAKLNINTSSESLPLPSLVQQQDAFLGKLVEGKLLQEGALAGDSNSTAWLCSLYREHADPSGFISSISDLSPDLRGAAYIAAVSQPSGCDLAYGDNAVDAVWNAMRKKWEQDEDIAESRRGLFALASGRQQNQIQSALDLTVDPDGTAVKPVTFSDTVATLKKLSRSQEGNKAVWAYLQEHWHAISSKLGSGVWSLLDQLPLLPTGEMLSNVQNLVQIQGDSVPSSIRLKILGRLTHNVEWAKDTGVEVCAILSERSGN